MKALRWLGIVVALLLVIVLAIPFLINVNQFRPRLEAALTQALGREVKLGDRLHTLSFGDTVYVAPNEVHQLRNVSKEEPFGFLCIVDAERDRPVLALRSGRMRL